MSWMWEMLKNPFVITGTTSWISAQILKFIIHAFVYKKIDIKRMFGDGGMPSGHSATVSSLAVICALVNGVGSFEFAISLFFAVIVCHDAMGVRRETGKQAVLLNQIIGKGNVIDLKNLPEIDLKEFVGHTPLQVTFGVLLGVCNALIMHRIFF